MTRAITGGEFCKAERRVCFQWLGLCERRLRKCGVVRGVEPVNKIGGVGLTYEPWRHPFGAFACCFGGPPRWRPSRREETQALKDYIADLKEDLEDAEERLKEVEKSPER